MLAICDKDCDISEYLRECECIESLVDDMLLPVVRETVDAPENFVINDSNEINYWLIVAVPLAIACLLLLVVIVVNYYIKRGLTIAYFLHISIIIKDLVVQWFF